MRRRLLVSTCLIALASVLVLGLPLAVVGSALLRQRADSRLERRADAMALRFVRAAAQGRPLDRRLVADLLDRGEAVRLTLGRSSRVIGTPPPGDTVEVQAGDAGTLQLALIAPQDALDDDVAVVWLAALGFAVAALGAAVALANVQARRLAAPLELLAGRVERVGHPDYDDRPVAGHVPEIDRLQQALNEADQRLGELVRREREFTANASHQLRSPLTGLRLRLEELRHLATSADAAEEADAALAQADRLVATIEHLEQVGRIRDDRPARVDLAALVRAHVQRERWADRYAAEGRALAVDVDAGVPAHAHPEAVGQIVDVLLDNALRHGRGTTAIGLRTAGDRVELVVSDEGQRSALPASGDLFARGIGHGTGIGLAVARELARDGGGDLRLAPADTTAFAAAFPAAD